MNPKLPIAYDVKALLETRGFGFSLTFAELEKYFGMSFPNRLLTRDDIWTKLVTMYRSYLEADGWLLIAPETDSENPYLQPSGYFGHIGFERNGHRLFIHMAVVNDGEVDRGQMQFDIVADFKDDPNRERQPHVGDAVPAAMTSGTSLYDGWSQLGKRDIEDVSIFVFENRITSDNFSKVETESKLYWFLDVERKSNGYQTVLRTEQFEQSPSMCNLSAFNARWQ